MRRKPTGELREGLHDLVQTRIGVEVVLLDVVDQGEGRMVVQEGSPVLAGLRHEEPRPSGERAMGNPLGPHAGVAEAAIRIRGTEAPAAGADDHARIEIRFDEQVAEQARGGALAVGAGDADACAKPLQFPECFRVAEDRHAGGPGRDERRVVRSDRRRGHDGGRRVGREQRRRGAGGVDRDADPLEAGPILRWAGIGGERRVLAAAAPSVGGEHRGEAAHPGAGHADEVEAGAAGEETTIDAVAGRGGDGTGLGGGGVHEGSVSVGSASPGQNRGVGAAAADSYHVVA